MRVVVTGGAGFMGAAFTRHIHQQAEVVCLDALTYAADLHNLEGFEYQLVEGTICNQQLVDEVVSSADAVVHFAAESHVDRSIDAPEDFVQTNVVGTYRLLEAVRKNPHVRFHHISTDEVYGSISAGAFNENSPYKPNSPYAASKAASDHFVRSYGKTYNLLVTTSHASNNYGPGQYPEKFMPVMIRALIEKKPLPVYGQGLNVRDWLYVDDHARAVWTILQKGAKGEVYNIGADNPRCNIDVLKQLISIYEELTGEANLEELITFVEDRPGHDLRYAIDASKLKKELGWMPQMPFDQGLKQTIQWYLDVSKKENRLCHTR